MHSHRIYTEQALSSNQQVTLNDGAARHIAQVLRLRPGATLSLFNGNGHDYKARLLNCNKHAVVVEITATSDLEPPPPISFMLAQGISKMERMDYALQKAVELGISSFIPLFTQRTVVKLRGERLERRLEHWRKIAISACEQSGRKYLPTIEPAMQLHDWLSMSHHGHNLILEPLARQTLSTLPCPTQAVQLLVGPEGGWSNDEIKLAQSSGFTAIRLGPRILRTETAPIATLAAMQMLWGDFR